MTDWEALDRFLETDAQDVGCDRAIAVLHVYVDLVLQDAAAAQSRYPGVEAHLRACGPCFDDFQGLLAAVSAEP